MYDTARLLDSYRKESEDRAEIIDLADAAGTIILVVADGVGGRECGGPAAERAVTMVREAATGSESLRVDRPEAWHSLLHEIDDALAADPGCGQTTLAAVAVTPRRLVGASVGDSEAWWIDADGHFDLTGGQRRKPHLGTGAAEVIPFSLPAPSGSGTLLVASDGLFKYTPPERILDAIAAAASGGEAENLDAVAKRLADLARLSSGQLLDDIALLLCRREGSGSPRGGLADRFRRLFRR
ncbi:MAG TPA: protein phosphatase 2C domain-containing protein [Armatimonadaceae bacterium]|nr:protein phosphatase 2C domain-containing protein [Armatimonadaceae bacterium]